LRYTVVNIKDTDCQPKEIIKVWEGFLR